MPHNKEQWFDPSSLQELFTSNKKIEYIYLQGLGNPAEFRKDEMYKNNPDKQKELYLQYLKSNHKEFATKNEFEQLYSLALDKQNLICLMCYCHPERVACHRFWLKEALVNRYRKEHDLSGAITINHYPDNHFEAQYKIQIENLVGAIS